MKPLAEDIGALQVAIPDLLRQRVETLQQSEACLRRSKHFQRRFALWLALAIPLLLACGGLWLFREHLGKNLQMAVIIAAVLLSVDLTSIITYRGWRNEDRSNSEHDLDNYAVTQLTLPLYRQIVHHNYLVQILKQQALVSCNEDQGEIKFRTTKESTLATLREDKRRLDEWTQSYEILKDVPLSFLASKEELGEIEQLVTLRQNVLASRLEIES